MNVEVAGCDINALGCLVFGLLFSVLVPYNSVMQHPTIHVGLRIQMGLLLHQN